MFGIQLKLVDRKQGITTQKLTEIRAAKKSHQKIQIIQLPDTDFKLMTMLSIFRQIKKQFRELDRKLEITKKNQMDILELKNSVGSFKSRLHITK